MSRFNGKSHYGQDEYEIPESTKERYAAFVREQLASAEARPRSWHEDDKISYFANINQRSAPVVNSGYSPSRFNGKSRYGQDELFEEIQESTKERYSGLIRERLKRD